MKKLTKRKKLICGFMLILAFSITAVVIFGILQGGTEMNRESMQKVFNSTTKSAQIHEAVLFVESTDGSFSESFTYGGRDIDSPMLVASITKMFTTACILKLCEEERISLDDKITLYFDEEQLKGLHVYKGHEYSFDLIISDLLFQTSGLPDSFEAGNTEILFHDVYTTFAQDLAETKELTPQFAPNTGKKAYYANINFSLLGEILMKVTDMPLNEIYEQMIFTPLGLSNTYLVVDANDFVPHMYYGDKKLELPKAIASSGAAGGCVSTPRDLMTFSKGFWEGKLFDKAIFEKLAVYRGLQSNKGPINYGGGYMQIPLEGFSTLFMGKGELVGHSGSTGSFIYYYPEKNLHFVGDLTQYNNPARPIRLVMRLAMMTKYPN